MTVATLDYARQIVDQLSPRDRAQLLAYLESRIAEPGAANDIKPTASKPALDDAWETFFRIGDEIAERDTPGTETLTAAISAMRR